MKHEPNEGNERNVQWTLHLKTLSGTEGVLKYPEVLSIVICLRNDNGILFL